MLKWNASGNQGLRRQTGSTAMTITFSNNILKRNLIIRETRERRRLGHSSKVRQEHLSPLPEDAETWTGISEVCNFWEKQRDLFGVYPICEPVGKRLGGVEPTCCGLEMFERDGCLPVQPPREIECPQGLNVIFCPGHYGRHFFQ